MFEIEKGVQIPEKNDWSIAASLKIGDSFFVDEIKCKKYKNARTAIRGNTMSSLNRKGLHYKIKICQVVGGYRVWRVK